MEGKRLKRPKNIPYLRIKSCGKNRKPAKKWFIRFEKNIEINYSRLILTQSGIDLTGKIVLFKDEYDWINAPTLNDMYLIDKSEYFKRNYIHNLSPEIKKTIHTIIELSKIINHELRSNPN